MNQEKIKTMAETSQRLMSLIQDRLNTRVDALKVLEPSPMDNIPIEIKQMREIESGKIRAIMQEQKELIDIIKLLFPSA